MITVKIKQSVSHDRYHLHQGEVVKLPNGIAQQLIEAGFAEEDSSDLVGAAPADTKMAAPTANKMETEPKNKAIKTAKAD